jgi:hypothetical protein
LWQIIYAAVSIETGEVVENVKGSAFSNYLPLPAALIKQKN